MVAALGCRKHLRGLKKKWKQRRAPPEQHRHAKGRVRTTTQAWTTRTCASAVLSSEIPPSSPLPHPLRHRVVDHAARLAAVLLADHRAATSRAASGRGSPARPRQRDARVADSPRVTAADSIWHAQRGAPTTTRARGRQRRLRGGRPAARAAGQPRVGARAQHRRDGRELGRRAGRCQAVRGWVS